MHERLEWKEWGWRVGTSEGGEEEEAGEGGEGELEGVFSLMVAGYIFDQKWDLLFIKSNALLNDITAGIG